MPTTRKDWSDAKKKLVKEFSDWKKVNTDPGSMLDSVTTGKLEYNMEILPSFNKDLGPSLDKVLAGKDPKGKFLDKVKDAAKDYHAGIKKVVDDVTNPGSFKDSKAKKDLIRLLKNAAEVLEAIAAEHNFSTDLKKIDYR